jgi:hypothetical protein
LVIGYQVITFNSPNDIDENDIERMKEIGLTDEIIKVLPENLTEFLGRSTKIIRLEDYDINEDNGEYLGTLHFKIDHYEPYSPPYSEEEIFDLYITFFKRKRPKMLINKDWLRYTYNYDQTLIFSFLNIEGVTYSGKIKSIDGAMANRYEVEVPGFITYEGFLRTTFKDYQNSGEDVNYELIYESTKDRVTKVD